MDNQHKHIKGYRDLSQAEIDAMNKVKQQGESLQLMVEELNEIPNIDKRWLAIATTDLQKGIMFAVRAIAQPTSF